MNNTTSPPAPLQTGEGGVPKQERVVNVIPALCPDFLVKITKDRLALILLFVWLMISGFQACKMSYSFTGANISADVKTFSVYYFPNRAKLVNPTLSSDFTEKLKEKLSRQTSLKEESETGDLLFEGQITGYEVRPMAIQKEDMAAQNRLTMTVRVKYTNNKDHEADFDRTFSAYEDFSSSMSLNDVESSIVPEILEKLMEDIFNATIANW